MIARWLHPWPALTASQPVSPAQVAHLAAAASERHAQVPA